MTVRYTNADGLTQQYGTKDAQNHLMRSHRVAGAVGQLVIDFDVDNLPGFDEGVDQSSTMTRFSEAQAFLPAHAWIMSATLLVTEEFDSAGNNSTLTIGTYEKDGTVIDADGIDAAVAEAALGEGDVVLCDGDQVAATEVVAAVPAYIRATVANSPTQGAARLVIEYMLAQ
jgi:hypothetical protein